MRLHLQNVLSGDAVAEIVAALREMTFEDGAATAGWHARLVKANRQARPSPALRALRGRIEAALRAHEVFMAAAMPARIAPALLSASGPGEGYGAHVDDPVMGGAQPMRTDISLTLFLSRPDDYDGGELVMDAPGGEEAVKLPAGDAWLYPSTVLHRVEPVRAGERLVAATWAQSRVRDAGEREILFDLDRARRTIFADGGKTPTFDLVSNAHANLMRRWVEL
jgi:PKHD-type hydroxylase